MFDNRSEGLLVRAEPLGLARQLCQRLVEEVHEADGALFVARRRSRVGGSDQYRAGHEGLKD